MIRTVLLLVLIVIPSIVCSEEPAVVFDVPALATAHPLIDESVAERESTFVIEMVLPVSVRPRDTKLELDEFEFEVYWNRNVYPLLDYGPKTRTGSKIDGLVSVEERQDRGGTLGLNVKSGWMEVVSGSAQAQLQNKQGSSLRYQEIPQQQPVISSGTIQRGTGAYFHFRPSVATTLEGGRELMVAFWVPSNWRGGLIQINAQAKATRPRFVGFTESVTVKKSYLVAVYLEGNEEAKDAAVELVRAENQLRRVWRSWEPRSSKGERDLDELLRPSNNHQLKKLLPKMSDDIRKTTERYLSAKKTLAALGTEAQTTSVENRSWTRR